MVIFLVILGKVVNHNISIYFWKKSPQFTTIAYNMKRCLIFILSYFEYFQIWLNIFIGDCHQGFFSLLWCNHFNNHL